MHKCTLKCSKDIPDKRYIKHTTIKQTIEINLFFIRYSYSSFFELFNSFIKAALFLEILEFIALVTGVSSQ